MVLYRKYRPQKLSELDLVEVREKLKRTLLSSFRPHAYLFSGPKGTGKTSAARIVAKILNCVQSRDMEPCNKCESCTAITEGRHLDVMEIDAASNRGIDEIRDLREKIKLVPVTAKYKVYIIDEVHMLTNDAFNALLKTLEEPPSHAVFILATTEAEKLPETIISRSTRLNFHRATNEELKQALNRIISGEKFKLETEVIDLIAEYADGSFRDATKLLEQAVNQGAITIKNAREMLGIDTVTPEKFLLDLSRKKTKELLSAIVEMADKGSDFRLFVTGILDRLQAILLDMHQIKQENLSEDLKNLFTLNELKMLFKLFGDTYSEIRLASRPELPLETAVVEWCEKK